MKILDENDINFVFGSYQEIVNNFLPSSSLVRSNNKVSEEVPKNTLKYKEKDISYEGKTFYMVPWALMVDENNNYFLDMSHRKHEKKFGTASMMVTIKDGMATCIMQKEHNEYSSIDDYVYKVIGSNFKDKVYVCELR